MTIRTAADNKSTILQVAGVDKLKINDTGVVEADYFKTPAGVLSPVSSFKNKIINGCGVINQRGAQTLTNNYKYFSDRMLGAISGGTAVSGSLTSGVFGGSVTGTGMHISGATFTNGSPAFMQRIESSNTIGLNGKTITISGKYYHNTEASFPLSIRLSKANSKDNFASTTVIDTATTPAVPSGAVRRFSITFTLGPTDGDNGIQVAVISAAPMTVSGRTFMLTEWQLEELPYATPFEQRPIGVELDMCERYYQKYLDLMVIGWAPTTSILTGYLSFPLPSMRAIPTVTLTTNSTFNMSGAVAVNRNYPNHLRLQISSGGELGSFFWQGVVERDAEL